MNIIETILNWVGQLNLINVPKAIIDHHAEAEVCTIEDIDRWHKARGWLGCGYHFFIRKDGSIYRGRPENAEGAHCLNYNTNSIGICHEGNYMVDDMPEAQKQASIELHKYLMQKYNINRIEPHRALYNTSCPGDKFPFDEIKNAALNTPGSSVNYQPIANRTWLQVGDTGDKVMDLQSKLSKLGYVISVDGAYGKETKNIVYKFQQDNGLQADGLAGNQTFNCLNAKITEATTIDINSCKYLQHEIGVAEDNIPGAITLSKCPLIQVGSTGNIVKWLQNKLDITDDGIFGNQTKIAVQNFQARNSLVADGIVGQNTWRKLLGI